MLVAADIGTGNGRTKIGVFPRALGAAAPSCVAGNVNHGGVDPVDACGAGLDGSHVGEISDQGGIPTGRGGQGNRKYGAEAVDDVGPKEQRDMQARIVHSSVLKMVGKALPNGVEHGA